jgi:hypothetical protein
MVYGIELLLKVLSEDWGPDGTKKTAMGHDVGRMYEKVFGRAYTKSDLMKRLSSAIRNQKFLYEPDGGLRDRMPEIEELWDELTQEYYQRHWGAKSHVFKEVKMDSAFAQYLLNNIPRFWRPASLPLESRQRQMEMTRLKIALLERRLQQLESMPDWTDFEVMKEATKEYEQNLQSMRHIMKMKFDWHGDQIGFVTWSMFAVFHGAEPFLG